MIAGEETPDKGQIIKQNGTEACLCAVKSGFSEDKMIRSYTKKGKRIGK